MSSEVAPWLPYFRVWPRSLGDVRRRLDAGLRTHVEDAARGGGQHDLPVPVLVPDPLVAQQVGELGRSGGAEDRAPGGLGPRLELVGSLGRSAARNVLDCDDRVSGKTRRQQRRVEPRPGIGSAAFLEGDDPFDALALEVGCRGRVRRQGQSCERDERQRGGGREEGTPFDVGPVVHHSSSISNLRGSFSIDRYVSPLILTKPLQEPCQANLERAVSRGRLLPWGNGFMTGADRGVRYGLDAVHPGAGGRRR